MRLRRIYAVDGLSRIHNLLGKNDAGVAVIFLCCLFQRAFYFLFLALDTSDLAIQLVALFPYLMRPLLHLMGIYISKQYS